MKTIAENIKPILALLIVMLGFAYFFVCFFSERKPDPQIIIAIVSLIGSTTAYYFGSSTGNQKKDETIQKLAEKQNETSN